MQASFALHLALRYLRSTRKDAFVTFLSWVAAGGIALGVFALVLSLAALAGFQRALKGEILRRTPMVEIALPPGADAAAWLERLRTRPEVRSARAVVHGRGWLLESGKAQAVEVVGFDGAPPVVLGGRRAAGGEEAPSRPPGVLVSRGLANRWGLEAGDPVTVVSPRPTLTPLGPQPRLRSLRVAGTFATGRIEHGERVGLPWNDGVALFGDADRRLEIEAADLESAIPLAAALAGAAPPGVTVRTWRDLNRPLFFALRLEKTVMFLAVSLVILVAAFALVSALSLLVANKRAEIGTLGALGAPPGVLRRGFVLLGLCVAGAGVVGGGASGLVAANLLDRFEVLRLPDRVYFLDHVPFEVQPVDLLAIAALATALAWSFSWIAARGVARLDPVEAMRR